MKTRLTIPSAVTLRRAADIKDQIANLETQVAELLSGKVNGYRKALGKRKMSQEARDKIAAAARKRWRIAKKAGRKTL